MTKLAAFSTLESAVAMNSILQVLVDIHTKDFTKEERATYLKKIKDRAAGFKSSIELESLSDPKKAQ